MSDDLLRGTMSLPRLKFCTSREQTEGPQTGESVRARRGDKRRSWTKDWDSNLTEGAPQALRGFLQLALEGVDLFRYIVELLFRQRSCFCNFLNATIRSAHRGPNSHRYFRESTLFCHFGLHGKWSHPIPERFQESLTELNWSSSLIPTDSLVHNHRPVRTAVVFDHSWFARRRGNPDVGPTSVSTLPREKIRS